MLGLVSLAIALTSEETPGAILLVFVSMPWAFVLTWIEDASGTERIPEAVSYAYVFLSAGILANALVLYLLAHWFRRCSD